MNKQNNYSNLSKEELLAKQTKLKSYSKIATVVCFLAVVNVFVGIYLKNNRGVFTVFLILGAMLFMMKYGNELKKIQEEINSRKEL